MNLERIATIAFTCFIGTWGMSYAFHKLFVKTMTKNPIYLEAMETVKRHNGARYLLGEPILSGDPVLANKGMLLAGYSDVQVRVEGPTAEGVVFLKVTQGEDNKVRIDSIQLQVGKDQTRRLVIKNMEEETIDSTNTKS